MIVRIWILFIVTIFWTQAVGQGVAFKKAISKGKSSQLYYEATFKKMHSIKSVDKWVDKNGYVLLAYLEEEIARFGGYEKGIMGARFVTKEDYLVLKEREKESRRFRLVESGGSLSSGEKTALALGAIAALAAGTKWLLTKMLTMPEYKPIPCVKDEKLINRKGYLFQDKNGVAVTASIYRVRCGNEKITYYYKLAEDVDRGAKSGGLQEHGYGRYNETQKSDGGYLNKYKQNALVKLCDCH